MDLYFISNERYYLQKLSKILNYHFSTLLLLLLSLFVGIFLTIAVIAAVIFIPFMLYVFMRLQKTYWIISFSLIVLIPFAISVLLGLEIGYLSIFLLVSLAFFYFYCFILKYMVNDRLNELLAREELELKMQAEKESEWGSHFNNKDLE